MIDKNEAPDGHYAERQLLSGPPCKECAFFEDAKCYAINCLPKERKDKTNVILKKRITE